MTHRFIIGRSGNSDFILTDLTVSSKHASLEIDRDGFVYVDDLGSRNGVQVNGRMIKERTRLKKGEQLRLGNFVFDWEAALTGNAMRIPAQSENQAPAHQPPISRKAEAHTARWVIIIGLFVVCGFVFFVLATTTGRETIGKIVGIDSASRAEKKIKKKRTYDISCLNNGSGTDELIRTGNDMEDQFIKDNKINISRDQEIKIGNELHNQVIAEYELVKDSKYESRVSKVFLNLTRNLPKSGNAYHYETHILRSDEINAFTAGGKIYITTGILDFMKRDDELACVIGHEIYHNELGHINKHLQKEAALKNIFGDVLGQIANMAGSIFTASFNQDEEAYCDLYGLDLAVDAGYEGCSIRDFWNRMSEKENAAEADKFFRTHPYASQRSKCIANHIRTNYNYNCQ